MQFSGKVNKQVIEMKSEVFKFSLTSTRMVFIYLVILGCYQQIAGFEKI